MFLFAIYEEIFFLSIQTLYDEPDQVMIISSLPTSLLTPEVWNGILIPSVHSVRIPACSAGGIPACLAGLGGGGWHPSMPCRSPGPHPKGS